MITPPKQKHTLYQGATWVWTYEVRDVDGNAEDLTDCTARLMIRLAPSSEVLIDVTGAIADPSTAGQVVFEITPDDTIGATWAEAGFDAELYWPNGVIDKLAFGTFKLVPEYTHDP